MRIKRALFLMATIFVGITWFAIFGCTDQFWNAGMSIPAKKLSVRNGIINNDKFLV